ncbi:NAD(P)H-dependent flavin oxidoreductase [Bartonella tamiae]|uniref:Nitronate monooxygenase n=1 Tax=Bartonella tamiae Th239 TaxID=1094558 RepID=J1JVR4_9HYPH|nr:nitronate monooxygenase [Bartonella tamiae]EJF88650.1 hypothetical protein ME5_01201 [Bartonella tamiae Th239]EJF95100.1 hypothetical protein MEG_00681 [Bartonella tamiae Th307]
MRTQNFLETFNLEIPLIQAPMAGVSTPKLSAAVCNAGAIGSLGLGASTVEKAHETIKALKAKTSRPFNLNFFCHHTFAPSKDQEEKWLKKLEPLFNKHDSKSPLELKKIYESFYNNDALLKLIIEEKPAIVSFHFGLPTQKSIKSMKEKGIYLIASATTLKEALLIQAAGFDGVIAQGYEAGGHRGIFNENSHDDCLSLIPLLNQLVQNLSIPVIAAGGLMDGYSLRAVCKLGAAAGQMGTAFIGCPESSADCGYRNALFSDAAYHTVMTRTFSGRPARALSNEFTNFTIDANDDSVPPYPYSYDIAKQLHQVGVSKVFFGYGAYWAGQGAAFTRSLPATELVKTLKKEYAYSS